MHAINKPNKCSASLTALNRYSKHYFNKNIITKMLTVFSLKDDLIMGTRDNISKALAENTNIEIAKVKRDRRRDGDNEPA